MPIIDDELVSDVSIETFESPGINVGDYFLDQVQKNVEKFGDGPWMVSFTWNCESIC